jgi:hypothetical protein
VLQAELDAAAAEAVALVARAVIGEDAAGLDSELAESGDGGGQEVVWNCVRSGPGTWR